jgi:hypothetical protein
MKELTWLTLRSSWWLLHGVVTLSSSSLLHGLCASAAITAFVFVKAESFAASRRFRHALDCIHRDGNSMNNVIEQKRHNMIMSSSR